MIYLCVCKYLITLQYIKRMDCIECDLTWEGVPLNTEFKSFVGNMDRKHFNESFITNRQPKF